jgi:sec-independent protein translocase protein TatC
MFGVTTAERLKKNRAYIIIGSFVLGMILTPPDIISQFLIAIPMWLLFEAGLFCSSFFRVRIKNTTPIIDNSETEANDWTDKAHNTMMDEIESEMNDNNVSDK